MPETVVGGLAHASKLFSNGKDVGLSELAPNPLGASPVPLSLAQGNATASNVERDAVQTPDPEVRIRRRRHTREYKLSILKQADKFKGRDGVLGEFLRREGLYTATLSQWRKQRDEGLLGQARGRKSKPAEVVEVEKLQKENRKLKEKIGQYQLVIEAQKKNLRDPRSEAGQRAADAGSRGRIRKLLEGLVGKVSMVFACNAMAVNRATAYRAIKPEPVVSLTKAEPARTIPRALPPEERKNVVELLNSQKFVDKSPHEVFARLLDGGIYKCSVRTMYRILSENNEVRERRQIVQRPHYTRPELIATAPNQVWSWDITKLQTHAKWTYFYLYVLMDIFSRYVVGWLIAERESGGLARQLIEQSCEKQNIQPHQLTIHSDRGGPMKAQPVAQLYASLGIMPSLSRPSVSNDNPFSESQFKTTKYHWSYPDRFGSLTDSVVWARGFFPWYNDEHYHSGLAYFTPKQVHYGLAGDALAMRSKALTAAFQAHPERFVKGCPTPQGVPTEVWINPPSTSAKDKEANPTIVTPGLT